MISNPRSLAFLVLAAGIALAGASRPARAASVGTERIGTSAGNFLKIGVARRAPLDTIDIDQFEDWYNEPSRGIGCFQDANILK